MATSDNQRTATLLIQARASSLSSYDAVVKSVDTLTTKISQQSDAADRGEKSIGDLTKSVKDLEAVGKTVTSQIGLIDSFNSLAVQLQTATEKSAAQKAAADELTASYNALANPTRQQTRDLASANASAASAAKAVDKLSLSLAAQESKLTAAKVPTQDLAAAQQKLLTVASQIGDALVKAGAAQDNYAANAEKAAADETARLGAATTAFNAFEAAARKGMAVFNAEQAEQAAKAIGDEEQALRSATVAYNMFQAAAKAGLSAYNDQQAAADKLSSFQKIGTDAQAAALSIGQMAEAATASSSPLSKFANEVLGIVDPAAQARSTLQGLETEANRLASEVGDASKPIKDYQGAINDLGRVQQSVLKAATGVDAYQNEQAALVSLTAAVEDQRTKLQALGQAAASAEAPDAALADQIRQQTIALTNASKAADTQRVKVAQLGAALEQTGIDTNDLKAAQVALASVATSAAGTLGKLTTAASGQNSAVGSFLGLKPYELQNLSYQVNDVVTQLGSGTKLTQVIAQQGGQIFQLFQGQLVKLVGFLPEIAAAAVVLGTIALAFKRVSDLQQGIKQFNAVLSLSVDASNYNSVALATQAQHLADLGEKATDATTSLKTFIQSGLDPSRINTFSLAAKNLAKITGEDIPTASKSLADAFTGGYAAVAKLDDSLNFLTVAERANIKAQFDSGDAVEARTAAFDALEKKIDDQTAKAKGPWLTTILNLRDAFVSFLDSVAKSPPFAFLEDLLKRTGEVASKVSGYLPGAGAANGQPLTSGLSTATSGAGASAASNNNNSIVGAISLAALNPTLVPLMAAADSLAKIVDLLPKKANNTPYRQPGFNFNTISKQDLIDATKTAIIEAGPTGNIYAVAGVIKNRAQANGGGPNSLQTTLNQPGAFESRAPANKATLDSIDTSSKTFADAAAKVAAVLTGQVPNIVGQANYFYNPGAQAAMIAKGSKRQATPSFAQGQTPVLTDNAGTQFFNGAFGGSATAATQAQQKAAADLQKKYLDDQIAAEGTLSDAQRLQLAQTNAIAEASAKNLTDQQVKGIALIAVATEQFKIDKERLDLQQNLTSTLSAGLAQTAGAQDSVAKAVDAVNAKYQILYATIAKLKKTDPNDTLQVNGQNLDQLNARLKTEQAIAVNTATMVAYSAQLSDTEAARASALKDVNDAYTAGNITATVAIQKTQQINAAFQGTFQGITDKALAFADSIKSAVPDPKLVAFVAKFSEAVAGQNTTAIKQELSIAEDGINKLVAARKTAITGVSDEAAAGTITPSAAVDAINSQQDSFNKQIQEATSSLLPLVQQIAGAKPSPDMQAFIAKLLQLKGQTIPVPGVAVPATSDAGKADLQQLTQANAKLNETIDARNKLVQDYTTLQQQGAISTDQQQKLTAQAYAESTKPITDQIATVQDLVTKLGSTGTLTGNALTDANAKLKLIATQAVYVSANLTKIQTAAQNAFVTGVSTAVDSASTSIGNLINGTENFGQVLGDVGTIAETFFANFLKAIAQAIIQIEAMAVAQSLLKSIGFGTPGGGVAGSVLGAIGIHHEGGLAGSASRTRTGVNPAMFLAAPRYHAGTPGVGLNAGEQAAILMKGEEVLTQDNPRHIKNLVGGQGAGSSAGGSTGISVINAFDAADMLQKALGLPKGQRALLNHVSGNKGAFKAVLS